MILDAQDGQQLSLFAKTALNWSDDVISF